MKKPRAVLASESKPCVDERWHQRFRPDYTAINVLCVCPPVNDVKSFISENTAVFVPVSAI